MTEDISTLSRFYMLTLLCERPCHGYEIIEELQKKLGSKVGPGTVYPFLRRIERRGLVRKTTISQGGRKRYVYHITKEGRALCEEVLGLFHERLQLSSLILENISDAVIATDTKGKIAFWNNGASKIFDYRPEEIVGEYVSKLFKPEEKQIILSAHLETARNGGTLAGEVEAVGKKGNPVYLLLTTQLLRDAKGEAMGTISVGKDITAQKNAQRARSRYSSYLSSIE